MQPATSHPSAGQGTAVPAGNPADRPGPRPTVPRARRVAAGLARVAIATAGLALAAAAGAIVWWHLGLRPVLTSSMRPTYGPGWAIVTRSIPTRDLRVGDIIVFQPPGRTASFAHRVVSIAGPADHPIIRTKGDANPVADPWQARVDTATVREVIFAVPWLGRVMVALSTSRYIKVLAVLVLGGSICLIGVRAILGPPQRRRRTAAFNRVPAPAGAAPFPLPTRRSSQQ